MRCIRAISAALQSWAALVALGIAPTLVAVVGGVAGIFGGFLVPALMVALVLSLAVNLLVAGRAVRVRLRQRALEREWRRQQEELAEQPRPEPERVNWLPDENGHPTASNADLDRILDIAQQAAIREIGPGARLSVSLVVLETKNIIFDARSRSDRKRCTVWVQGAGYAHVYSKERWNPADEDTDPDDTPLWRRDASWINLLTESWRIERPFQGSVYLWPISTYQSHEGLGAWRLCYTSSVEGFQGEEHCYVLLHGALSRHPVPDPRQAPTTEGGSPSE